MTADEFRAIRTQIGLTQAELAAVLGYKFPHHVTNLESHSASGRAVPQAIAKLMRAYAEGYRPKDWPAAHLEAS